MTQRQRILAPFRGIRPDRPAWVADLSYWFAAMRDTGRLDERYRAEGGYDQLHRDLGVALYYTQGGSVYSVRRENVHVETEEKGGVRTRTWRTPVGEIAEQWQFLAGPHCWARTQYAASTAEDLRVVQDIFRRTEIEPAPEVFEQASERLGENGLPISPAPRSPLPALMTDWCGVTGTSYLLADEPAAVEDTLAAIEQANDAAWQAIYEGPAELIHVCDNLDSNTYTGLFDRHMRDRYARGLAGLHAEGKYAVTHLDGAVRGLLPKLAEVGFDGVESITPEPVGDVAIRELRDLCGEHDTIVWGGIPGAMFAEPWGPEEIRTQTEALLDELWPDNRLIVGSADQVPPDGEIDLCRVVTEAIAERCG
jgi:hypothetical protein